MVVMGVIPTTSVTRPAYPSPPFLGKGMCVGQVPTLPWDADSRSGYQCHERMGELSRRELFLDSMFVHL